MKINNKALASVVLSASIILNASACIMANKHDKKVNADIETTDKINEIDSMPEEVISKDTEKIAEIISENNQVMEETIQDIISEDNQEVEEPVQDVATEEVDEHETVREMYRFAYMLYDTVVFDNPQDLNEIDIVENYQRVFIANHGSDFSLIEYVISPQEVKFGYVHNSTFEILPRLYIDIDISDQTISLYDGEELILTSPVVTGMDWDTPTEIGYHEIYAMEQNVFLKSYNDDGSLRYSSYVDYWMPFCGGIGIHDAEYHTHEDGLNHGWRSIEDFGGDTYKYNGSHGCVNTPNEVAKVIYENVQVGTKVLVHK